MAPNNTEEQRGRIILSNDDNETEIGNNLHDFNERNLKINPVRLIRNLKHLDFSKVVWRNVILFAFLHAYAFYGLYLCFTGQTKWQTVVLSVFLVWAGALGVTMGAHRLWSHRSYKTVYPIKGILMILQTLSFQNSIYDWSRDHRVHHKHTETDGDPHNARRGLFFAHMGWLMYKKHPDVIKSGKTLDCSDLLEDPLVKFQHNHYLPLVLVICFILPTIGPVLLWNEYWVTALMVSCFMRYTILLHITWTVNSLAHYVGARPYDMSIYPAENILVAYLALGEGWHNYHHVFPYDYKAAEFGGVNVGNVTTMIIELLSKIGLTYDLKAASKDLIERRIMRTGNPRIDRRRPQGEDD